MKWVLLRRVLELAQELEQGDDLDREVARWLKACLEHQPKEQKKRQRLVCLKGHGPAGRFYLSEEYLRKEEEL